MPLTLQRLIDHISGATCFDITKFALKIKSSIFVLVNLKTLILFDLSWGAVRENPSHLSWQPPSICITDTCTAPAPLQVRTLTSLWQIYSLAVGPPTGTRVGGFYKFYMEITKGKFKGRLKRGGAREKGRCDALIHHFWGRNKSREIIRFPPSTNFSHGNGCQSPPLTVASRKQTWPSALICFYIHLI